MKKTIVTFILCIFMISFSGCGRNIELKEGEVHVEVNQKGEMIIRAAFDERDLEDEFGVDFDDDNDEIIDDIDDSMDDDGIDGSVLGYKSEGDTGEITFLFDEVDDFITFDFYSYGDTLEDLAGLFYEGFDEYSEAIDYEYFKDGENVDEEDLDDYEDYLFLPIGGGTDGMYITVPSEIIIITEDTDWERINKYTVYIDEGESGFIVFDKE